MAGERGTDLWGYADLHWHPMAHLGFGGASKAPRDRLFWGAPEGTPETALACCSPGHGILKGALPKIIESSHGEGWKGFGAWPRHNTLLHQQMYVAWIRRAYDSGLRLVCALAVNNELLADMHNARGDHSDMTAIAAQLGELRAIAARHADWMEVVGSPAEARKAITAGKLAIVPGVEVDTLGGWAAASQCSDADVLGLVDRLYDQLGVRSVTAIHLANNAFGGCAITGDKFAFLNHYLTRKYLQRADGFYAIDLKAKVADLRGVEYLLGCDPDEAAVRNGYQWTLPDYCAQRLDGHVKYAVRNPHGSLRDPLIFCRESGVFGRQEWQFIDILANVRRESD